ncbi:MAG: PEGA domain-containing protein [Terriglobia bacterium]
MRRESAIPKISTEYVQRDSKWAWLGTVFMLVYLSTPAPAAQVRVVQGQMVRLKLHNVLTTENVVKGDPLDFDVAEDVVVATHMVIQKGAPARGKVVGVKGAGKRNAKDASVSFQFVSVRSVDSQDIPLRARPDKHKKAESKENEVEANDPLPGYAQRVIGAEKGKEYAAYVDVSATVNVPDTQVVAPPITPVPSTPANPQGPTPPASTGGLTPAPANPLMPEEPASVDFNSNPPGADILIDGNVVGNTPSTLHVDAGRHVIQLRIGGYRSWTRTMVVEPGSSPSIRATLEKQ